MYFEKEYECNMFVQCISMMANTKERRELFIVKQSQSSKRKNLKLKQYEWFKSHSHATSNQSADGHNIQHN